MRTRSLPLLLLSLAAAAACGDAVAPGDPTTGAAGLRVINAAAAPVDVVVDGRVLVQGLAALAVSERIGVDAGAHLVRLRHTGGTGAGDATVDARGGETATVAAVPVAGQLAVAALSDTRAAPLAGAGKLRVVHLAANAPALDVWRTQPDYCTAIRVMFPFPYRAESSYLQSTPGSWEVWVTRQGETAPRLATSGPVPVAGGEVRTLVILDAPGGGVKVQALDKE